MALVLLAACNALGGGPVEAPAASMLPDLAGYNTVEGQTLTEYIAGVSGGAALLTGQPQLAAVVAAVDEIAGCYQDVGAARFRVYSRQEAPLEAGAVAIADRNALTDPANLFRCVGLQPLRRAPGELEPCATSYTLEKDDNAFYIAYAGTTPAVCSDFCGQLEGCTAH
jgi:hypothetical protein